MEGEAVHELPVPQGEQLHRGPVTLDCEADHVDRPDRALVGGLALREALDRAEPVAVARRLLEALLGSRLAHTPLQGSPDRTSLAGEELDHAVDDLAVRLLRDRADARSGAPLDMEVEARDPRVPARPRAFARPELEDAVEHVEGLAHLLRIRIRAEVDRSPPVPSRVNITRGYGSETVTAMYGKDLSSRSLTLNGGRCRLTRFCSRCSASASLWVTITSTRPTRPTSWSMPARASPPRLK